MTYDTEPDSCDPGRQRQSVPTPYRCLDCAWIGKGARAQADHYTATGHHIVWQHDPRQMQMRKVG